MRKWVIIGTTWFDFKICLYFRHFFTKISSTTFFKRFIHEQYIGKGHAEGLTGGCRRPLMLFYIPPALMPLCLMLTLSIRGVWLLDLGAYAAMGLKNKYLYIGIYVFYINCSLTFSELFWLTLIFFILIRICFIFLVNVLYTSRDFDPFYIKVSTYLVL